MTYLSLKKYPELNQYNFLLEDNFLILEFENKIILKINIDNQYEVKILCSKLEEILPNKKVSIKFSSYVITLN